MTTAAIIPWALAACSGSGGGASPAPTPTPTPTPSPRTNTAPGFTSPDDVVVVENSTFAYQAVAVDLEGDPITFTIDGGSDAAKFTMTPAGAMSFITPPNYERPEDAAGTNGYSVRIRASDGQASTTLAMRVIVSNSREGIAVRRIATGFSEPVHVAPVPGDASRIFVVERGGGVWILRSDGSRERVLVVDNLSLAGGKRGLLGFAARPDFATSSRVFAHVTGTDGALELREYRIGSPGYRLVLSTPHPTTDTNGGWIGFGPDGYLYAAVGDSGKQAQDSSSRLGKMLRIRIDTASGSTTPFGPAPGNLYAAGGGDPYVYALGLRNPYRASFYGNKLLIGDTGDTLYEEVNLADITQGGLNYGAGLVEGTGTTQQTPPLPPPPAGTVYPVTQFPHNDFGRNRIPMVVIGGYVYDGPIASLRGQYVFASYVPQVGTTNIQTVPLSSLVQGSIFPYKQFERRNLDFEPDTGTADFRTIISFGEDADRNLYLVDYSGSIFKAIPG